MDAPQLAEVNIARLLAPLDSPQIADFVAALDPVNALADAAPGFVWRLQTEDGDATSIRGFDDDMIIVNLTVWESIEALSDFAFRSDHRHVLRRRREWFEKMVDPVVVLWWVPAGHRPTVAEARDRLDLLRAQGPTPAAFTFRSPYGPDGAVAADRGDGAVGAAARHDGHGGVVVPEEARSDG